MAMSAPERSGRRAFEPALVVHRDAALSAGLDERWPSHSDLTTYTLKASRSIFAEPETCDIM
jgi:hypothetical protein